MASSFLGAFTSLISGKAWSDLPASFCYTIGEKVSTPYGSVFQLFDGSNTTDKSKVSVFVFDKKSTSLPPSTAAIRLEYARNCLKNIRTVRHPYILRTLEAVEVPSGIYIVTESVRPLVSSDIPSDPIWGIFQIASAVEFLHNDVKAVHGLISPFSVFVTTQDAHWRLGGFDIIRPLSSFGSSSISHDLRTSIQDHPLRGSGYAPPLDTLTPLGLDKWGLVSFIAWVYASLKATSEDAKLHLVLSPESNIPKVPAKAQILCKDLLKSSRTTAEPLNFKQTVATNSYFSESAVLKVMLFFDQINLKGNWEKESFFTSLPDVLTKVPPQIQYLQVLPQLTRQLDFYQQPALLLPSILLVGEALLKENASNKEDLYKSRVVPVLTKLFKCPDRAIRYSLLQHLPSFESYLDSNDVEDVFDPLCLGFTDSSNLLREATLKSMCILVPKLKKSSSVDKAIRLMTRILQQDTEAPIRTNAVICFAKLAPSFSKDLASKVLGTAFLGALRDPFPPCRLAALQSVAVCAGQDIFSANEIVTRIMPTVCQRCVDSEQQVRTLSFMTLEALLYQARVHLDGQQPEVTGVEDGSGSSTAGQSKGYQSVKQGLNKQSSSNSSSWTGWAVKKAIDFYGSKENEGASMEATIENTPSGNFKFQAPSPPPSTPTIHKTSVKTTKPDHHDDGNEFFDATDLGEGDVNQWDDFDDPAEFRQVAMGDDADDDDEHSQPIPTIPTPCSHPIPLLAPPPSSNSHVSTTPPPSVQPYTSTPTIKPSSSSSKSSTSSLSTAPSNSTSTTAHNLSQQPTSSLKPLQLSNTSKSKPSTSALAQDFWTAFDSGKSHPGNNPTVDPSTVSSMTKSAGAQSLKDILAAKKNNPLSKKSNDPFADFL